MSITKQLEIVHKALHTGQVSAAKIDAQRAFVEVEQFVNDLLAIVTLTQADRPCTGSRFEFAVSGNGESWAAYVGEHTNLSSSHSKSKPFEAALRDAGGIARLLLADMHERREAQGRA